MTRNNTKTPPWSFRRRAVVATLCFCASVVALCLFDKNIGEVLATTAITSAFTLAGGVIGSYIFGAVWHDKGSSE